MLWINFLHFYQPPTASDEVVGEAADKSYCRLVKAMKAQPKLKFTVNIAGCLLERLALLGYEDLISDFKKLIAAGQLEIVGSAAYHPFLPVLDDAEIIRQIKLNETILKKYLGQTPIVGFFSPEMAYSPRLAKLIKKMGFKWLLIDEIALSGNLRKNQVDYETAYIEKTSRLTIVFRDRGLSKNYVPKNLLDVLNKNKISSQICLTATDAELYGLRHNDLSASLEKIMHHEQISCKTISEYLSTLSKTALISPLCSSWESTAKELIAGQPYRLWHDQKNKVQVKLWQLADLAQKAVNQGAVDPNYVWARYHLDRGLASCAWWWASGNDFELFGGPAWNPDEIIKGATELVKGVRSLEAPRSKNYKLRAEKIFSELQLMVWQKHWQEFWGKGNKAKK